jgi:hypothetical protein
MGLEQYLGDTVEIEKLPGFRSAENIAQTYREGTFDDMVIVAPLSVIAHVVDLGVRPLWSESVEEPDRSQAHFQGGGGKWFRFVRFRRIKTVLVEFED